MQVSLLCDDVADVNDDCCRSVRRMLVMCNRACVAAVRAVDSALAVTTALASCACQLLVRRVPQTTLKVSCRVL